MGTRTERDTEIRTEVYETPMLDEIGGFTVMTRFGGDIDIDRFSGFKN